MYTLYGKKGSGSASTQVALEIIGAPYRIVETASWDTNDAFVELLKVNPLGQIPTLVLDDGSVLSESAAILIHLGSAHPESGLLPRDASARAQAIRGLVFIAANCYAAISIIDYPERWCADADDDDAVKDRIRAGTRARLHRHWEMFADLFPARPYLGGSGIGRARSPRRRRVEVVGVAQASGAGAPRVPRNADAHRSASESRAGLRAALGKVGRSFPSHFICHSFKEAPWP